MKESMKYLTNHYQLREFVLIRMLEIINQNKSASKGGIVFYGDSITQYCDLNKYYPQLENTYNCGIAGITSRMLLNFIDEGVIKYAPSKVVIMVGTNDLGNTVMESPRQIALVLKEMVEIIHFNLLDCKIYLISPIPCLEEIHGYKATNQGMRSNDVLAMIFQECQNMIRYDYVSFIDVFALLEDKKHHPDNSYYTDGLHINDQAYRVICQKINQKIIDEE